MRPLAGIAAALAGAAVVAGCGAPAHSSRTATASPAAAPPPASAPSTSAAPSLDTNPGDVPAAPGPNNDPNAQGGPLYCNTVVDSGPPSVTAQKVISGLRAVDVTSPASVPFLDTAALDLANYSGTRLANDAANFVTDEGSSDVPPQPVNVSAVQADITALESDCPGH
jgi:hypothetical protein